MRPRAYKGWEPLDHRPHRVKCHPLLLPVKEIVLLDEHVPLIPL